MCASVVAPTNTRCASIAEVTLKTAIDAHLRWKDGLENYVHGVGDERLTLDAVAADDRCLLGKWIHGPGQECFGQSEIFHDLVEAHARFHCHAAGIVASMQQADVADAMERMQVGDYPRTSAEVKLLLARLYVEALCEQRHAS